MTLAEIILIAVGLAMDAFAVSICKGLTMQKVDKKLTLWIAGYFGFFQAMMPMIGWFLGSQFAGYVQKYAPWIAFVLLALIGGNMIRESFSKEEESDEKTGHKELLVLAVATSIDALAVGVTFSMLTLAISVWTAFLLIGVITFAISVGGVFIGNIFGVKYKNRAEFAGGVILILIGCKVLLEHLLT